MAEQHAETIRAVQPQKVCATGPIYFDSEYYLSQIADRVADPLAHYLKEGYRWGCNPTRFFDQRWYSWQNPQYRRKYENSYIHYLEVGRLEGRDPCARADMKRYEQMTRRHMSRLDHYPAILSGIRSSALGIYEDWEDLLSCQRAFRDSIGTIAHKLPLYQPTRRYLVFLQCGPQSFHRQWRNGQDRSWDLLLNYYDVSGWDLDGGDFVFFQPGTKFTAVHNILTRFPTVLRNYRYVLFLDDDIEVEMGDLDRLFAICEWNGFDLAQMSLSTRSQCIWPVFFNKGSKGCRHVTGVEIMMPVLSAHALSVVAMDFQRSISGFGLDLLFGRRILREDRPNIAVVDEVVAHHTKSIDDSNGPYYAFLRSRMINPKAELWYLAQQFDLPLGFSEC